MKRIKCRFIPFTGNRLLLTLFVVITSPFFLSAQQIDMSKLSELKPRSIGPAGMSGRVTAIDVVTKNPEIIYIGSASGGLWKSESGGISWTPIFDDQKVASIGALSIFQSNPDVIWVGTGEGNPRNSITSGGGVYRSIDGGKTWELMGLEKTRNIHRIYTHSVDPDIVYVGAIGSPWGESEDRGVYKTEDGGSTWKKVLYVNENTGVGDMVIDPTNPDKLIVALWEHRRWPWFFKSGGPGSGIYVTFDGGENWEQRTSENGLPEGEMGRTGLAIAPSNPNVVYALVESKKNALYRSDDGGLKWVKQADQNIGNRPFYYHDIFVDSKNENRVYNLYSNVTVSNDGGKTFERGISYIHSDHHAWYVHPDNPKFIIDGNDGGAAISRDRGETWQFIENLPLAQFYHINVDMEYPYNVMGGMQDNGSWRGPGYVWRSGGIRNSYWEEIMFGDGFDVVPDQSDPRYCYGMSQGGNVGRIDLATGNIKSIRPIHPEGERLRFNWNAAIAHDPFNKTTIYYGSQYVHKSVDRGNNWEIISPDLTTNDPGKQDFKTGGLNYDATGAENHTTIIAIEPSSLEEGLIWAGTDDGNVQLTRDGGDTWTNVTDRIQGVPAGSWVPQIKASLFNSGEAFVVINNYRRDDWTPYVYRTKDFGNKWERIVDENDVWGYVLCIQQDLVEPKLIFLGTEFGLYVSIDEGSTWSKWEHGYPTVSTYDMVIHPREHDLVIATFGRSAYVFDDIRPIREIAGSGPDLLKKPIHVFSPPDAYLAFTKQATGTRFAGDFMYAGENRPTGSLISFSVNKGNEGEEKQVNKVKLEIIDSENTVIKSQEISFKDGVNRLTWNLNKDKVPHPDLRKSQSGSGQTGNRRSRGPSGTPVLPGTYTVRMSIGGDTSVTTLNVKMDPRIDINLDNFIAGISLAEEFSQKQDLLTEGTYRLNDAKEIIGMITNHVKNVQDKSLASNITREAKKMSELIKTIEVELNGERDVQGILRDPTTLNSIIRSASSYLQPSLDPPGHTQEVAKEIAYKNLEIAINKINSFFENEWKEFRKIVEEANLSLFKDYDKLILEN